MRPTIQRKTMDACIRAICAALALFALFFAAPARAEADGMLRVKLARLGSPSEITLKADCDYTLASDPGLRISAGTELTVTASGGRLTLAYGGARANLGASAQLVRDASGNKGIRFLSPALSNRFCGDLALTASGDAITAVLRLYVEDYLYGVVGHEMAPSSALEALKAQAIVARTYALRQKSARSGSAYDLSDSGDALSFRGYNGSSEYAAVIRAVDATRGQALGYGDGLALCYFCESNGGQTESSANALGVSLPYTQVMDDPYDFDSAAVKKSVALRRDGSNLPAALVKALIDGASAELDRQGFGADRSGVKIAAIEAVVPEKPLYAEPSRLFQTLAVTATFSDPSVPEKTATATVRVPTYGGLEDWCDLGINDEDNETVWVTQGERSFEVTFRRRGSGVGMSQRGAQAMAKKGLSCETILDYYYPGTAIRAMQLADAARESAAARVKRPEAQPIATARLSQKCRLYESPDASAPLTTLPAGATVAVYGVQAEWAAVGSGDLYGYIHAEGLASFKLAGASATQVLDETFAQVSAASAAVLQLPVETALTLETLSKGATVSLKAYTDQWAMVVTDAGAEGFIPRKALTLQAEPSTVEVEDELYGLLTESAGLYVNADDSIEPKQKLEKGQYVQIVAYNSSWASVRTAEGLAGYVKLNCLSAVQQPPEAAQEPAIEGDEVTVLKVKPFRYVNESELTLYESYSEASAPLATLKKGDKVQLGAYNEKWACVRVSGKIGFVLLEGLSETAPEPDPIEGGEIIKVKGVRYATVAVDGAALYPSYDDSDDPLTRLSADAKVRLGAYNGLWACVRVDGKTGFMRIDTLDLGG